jgi:hypothetical protein
MPKTAEELAAEEKAKAEAEASLKGKGAGDGGDDGDLASKDTSKFTPEQMTDYIDKLKDENAKRRIKANKLQDQLDKQAENQTKTDAEVQAMKDQLAEYEKKEKEAADKEKTEIERLTSRIADMEKDDNAAKRELADAKKELAKTKQGLAQKDRESMVDRLCHQLKFQFSSEFERDGFLNSITKTNKEGGFELNDEEVILKVKDFAKTNSKGPEVPGGGPSGRQQETPLSEEIKALLAKKTLTAEDSVRLDELLEEVGKAATATGP